MGTTFDFDRTEMEIIRRLYDTRTPLRMIAKAVDRSMVSVARYIQDHLDPANPKNVAVEKKTSDDGPRRRSNGVREYTDPLAAAEGSKKLLEAMLAYYDKRNEVTS